MATGLFGLGRCQKVSGGQTQSWAKKLEKMAEKWQSSQRAKECIGSCIGKKTPQKHHQNPHEFLFEILCSMCSIHRTIYQAQPGPPFGPLAANSDVKSCYQGGYFHKGGMIKLHPDPPLCRWDPCNCQYHRDTILDQVSVVMLKMDRLCKHPNQEHLQKCGLGMVSNPHYCCCLQSERFPRDTGCKCLCQNCHSEMFLLDMDGIPLDLWLLAVFLDLVHILHTEKIPMVQWVWIGRYPPCRVDVSAAPAKHCRHGTTNINIPQPVLTVPSPMFKTQEKDSCTQAFPTLLWPNNQLSGVRVLTHPEKKMETWKDFWPDVWKWYSPGKGYTQ